MKRVERIIGPIGNGCTKPLRGIIDGQECIIKTFNNEQSNRTLVNEYVGYEIAKKLDLNIPNSGICIIDENTEINKDKVPYWSDDFLGLGFYSVRINKISTIISPIIIKSMVSNINMIIDIVLFDHLICNKDRNKGNILLQQNNTDALLYIIDHSHIFNLGTLWDEYQLQRLINEDDYTSNEVLSDNSYMYGIFRQAYKFTKENLYACADKFKKVLNREFLEHTINSIPDVWSVSANEKNALLNYICYRLNNLYNICDIILNN